MQQHNTFTQLDDPVEARRLADPISPTSTAENPRSLGRQVNPLLRDLLSRLLRAFSRRSSRGRHGLAVHQSPALAGLYRSFLETEVQDLTPRTSCRFLGRKSDRRFDREVQPTEESVAGSAPASSTA